MGKLIILNNKMNLEYDEVYNYIDKLNKIDTDNNIVVCPSYIYLENFINNCSWGVGAQNVYYKSDGDFTGEISTLQLKSLGAEYVIIGHNERRKYFSENNDLINKKLNACLDSNIEPILCFGENGNIEDVKSELDELLKNVDNIHFIVFAYEPLNLDYMKDIDVISEEVNSIYDYLYDKYKTVPNIVYGGGVDDNNINDILEIDKLNGVLVGGISADIDFVYKMINKIKKK